MTLLKGPSDGDNGKSLRQVGLLTAIPALIVVAPLIGFFVGQWLDGLWGTDPYLAVIGAALGFGSAGMESYNIIRKAQSLDDKRDNDEHAP
jgi:F0F1-type ATP synthase assembly protein I